MIQEFNVIKIILIYMENVYGQIVQQNILLMDNVF
jgi:hypothetical protein